MLEQRKSHRFELRLPLELLRNGPQRILEVGETRNVSSSGVLFHSVAHLDPGDVVEFAITLPTSTETVDVRLKCKGKIVRRAAEEEAAATVERWEFVRARSLKSA